MRKAKDGAEGLRCVEMRKKKEGAKTQVGVAWAFRLTVSPAPDRHYLARLELDSVHGMRFHKLPLQIGNSLGPLIIESEVSDGPASACIQGRWFHQWQLRFVESQQLIANL